MHVCRYMKRCICIGVSFIVFCVVCVLCESPLLCCLEGSVGEWPGNKPTHKLVYSRRWDTLTHTCIHAFGHTYEICKQIYLRVPSPLTAVRSGCPAGRACAHYLSSLRSRQHKKSIRKNTRPNAWLLFFSICRSKKKCNHDFARVTFTDRPFMVTISQWVQVTDTSAARASNWLKRVAGIHGML